MRSTFVSGAYNEDSKMTDEQQVDDVQVEDIDYKAEYEKTKGEIDKYKKENADFFKEMKTYKERAKEYEGKLAEKDKTVDESKSYKERYESLEKQRAEELKQFEQKQADYDKERVRNRAMTLANQLDPLDDGAAEILADYLEKRLKMTDEGIAILDKDGKVSNLKDEDLKEEFKAIDRFKRQMRGRDSSGSGASGSGKVGGTNKLDQFAKMKPMDRLTALREGKYIE